MNVHVHGSGAYSFPFDFEASDPGYATVYVTALHPFIIFASIQMFVVFRGYYSNRAGALHDVVISSTDMSVRDHYMWCVLTFARFEAHSTYSS